MGAEENLGLAGWRVGGLVGGGKVARDAFENARAYKNAPRCN